MGSLALGLVSFGGRRGSSASFTRYSSFAPRLGQAPGLLQLRGHAHTMPKRKGTGSRCPS